MLDKSVHTINPKYQNRSSIASVFASTSGLNTKKTQLFQNFCRKILMKFRVADKSCENSIRDEPEDNTNTWEVLSVVTYHEPSIMEYSTAGESAPNFFVLIRQQPQDHKLFTNS